MDGCCEFGSTREIEEDDDIVIDLEIRFLLGLLDSTGEISDQSLVFKCLVLSEIKKDDEVSFSSEFEFLARELSLVLLLDHKVFQQENLVK